MRRRVFERLVREAVGTLPPELLARLDNVDVLVEEWPTAEQVAESGLAADETLFGLYQGIPLVDRQGYNMVLPDVITIFQGPIEEACSTAREVVAEVRVTVAHELAHHFGIGDEQLEAWGLG